MEVFLLGVGIQILGGITAFGVSRYARTACAIGASSAVLGSLPGLATALAVLFNGHRLTLVLPWDAAHGQFAIELDSLGSVFLLPVSCLTILCAVYGANYLLAYRGRKALGPPWFFFNLFVAGMSMVIVARSMLLFLMAWEVMSVAAYFLVTFDHEDESVRRAGWIYLIASQLGVGFLFAALAVLGSHAGSLEFAAFSSQKMGALGGSAVFLLALVGFGAKAGLVPFHVWLPEAHPAAPSHVSAMMSGVMIKMGLYGFLRVLTFLGEHLVWWGPTLAALGLLTAIIGISLALHQRDIKRVLAYSSIENMGLIALSLGVGVWGNSTGRPIVASLGIAGGLLHMWNHVAMKGLMFLTAGSVVHGAGTRDMERLGGLMKRMPWTGIAMIAGAVAIAGLPPLNGFASKWLMYLALMEGGLTPGSDHGLVALLAVGLLAVVGTLAVVAFVRLTGIVLLGTPRSHEAAKAHESSPWMLVPIGLLLVLCGVLAIIPHWGVNLLSGARAQLLGPQHESTWTAFDRPWTDLIPLGAFNARLIGFIGLAGLLFVWLLRRAPTAATWGCGYADPNSRMQYTGCSFAEQLTGLLLPSFLRPRTSQQAPQGLFPTSGKLATRQSDPVTETIYEPFFTYSGRRFSRLRILQQGRLHLYLMYILLTVVLALTWVSLRSWWGTSG